MSQETARQQKKPGTRRILRTFGGWVVFVLVLYGIQTISRLAEETRLKFSVTLDGVPVPYEAVAELDNERVGSNDKLRIGRRRFVISHPKGVRFSTNFFAWYGVKDLGVVNLRRMAGTLHLAVERPAPIVRILGDETTLTFTNFFESAISLPTGQYRVEAHYAHHVERGEAAVTHGGAPTLLLKPAIGALEVVGNKGDTKFELFRANELLASGSLPKTIVELPSGEYRVQASHNGHTWKGTGTVVAGQTNRISADFKLGAVRVESNPSGAEVIVENGRRIGTTPIFLADLSPGKHTFLLRLNAYQPADVTIEVKADQTNSVGQKLVKTAYAQAMWDARQAFTAGAYDRTISALQAALQVEPGDSVATTLLRETRGLNGHKRAEAFQNEGNLKAAIAELETVLSIIPGDEKAVALLKELNEKVGRIAKDEENDRLNRAKNLMAFVSAHTPDAPLFETNELVVRKRVDAVESAIEESLRVEPAFKIIKRNRDLTDAFEIHAEHEIKTVLNITGGKRRCIIVGAQIKPGETHVLFKVIEYKAEAVNKLSIGNLINAPVAVNLVPVHSSRVRMTDDLKTRVEEGIGNLRSRIREAVGSGRITI